MPVRGEVPTCAICGRVGVTHALVFELYKYVCQPPIYPDACCKAAMARGWRMDGMVHGWGTDYEVEPLIGREFIWAVTRNAHLVLEWGAGYGTCEHPKHVLDLERWLTIDDCWMWTILPQEEGLPGKTSIVYIPQVELYAAAPKGVKWDSILIDGHWRDACLKGTRGWLAEGGVVLCQEADEGGEHHYGGPAYDFSVYPHLAMRHFKEIRSEAPPVYALCSDVPIQETHCWPELQQWIENIEIVR